MRALLRSARTFACLAWFAAALAASSAAAETAQKRPHIAIRGVYGGFPPGVQEGTRTLADYGVNAIWFHSRNVTHERVALVREQGAKFFAEFNTMRNAGFLQDHPDAAPVGTDGQVAPPADGWQGLCPTHPEHRRDRMAAFRELLVVYEVDGIWLDYHHSHSNWEQPDPNLPDTCFCARCLARFQDETGIRLPDRPAAELSQLLLSRHRAVWVQWRCDVFTGWVREFRELLDATRPEALLGTFHAPWNETERGGALREKLAIDLKAQAPFLDVFSPMPYHARFGHARDLGKIADQIAWLGGHLGIAGTQAERLRIWPIVQLSDTGEPVPVEQVQQVLEHGSRRPATGITVFSAGAFRQSPEKAEELGRFYRAIRP